MQPLAILALVSAASAFALEERQSLNDTCVTGIHVIAVGGGNSNDEYSLGLLSTLTTNITAAIPDSSYYSLPYDKVDVGQNMLSPTAIPQGISTLISYVGQYTAACPNTKIAIIGYSSGADIVSLPMCDGQLSQSLAGDPIVASVWYGAETYVPNLSYDTGTCTNGTGTHPLTDPVNGCGAYVPLLHSYCNTNDPQCCSGPPQDYEIHFTYPPDYDLQATQFVVSQFNKFGGHAGGSGTGGSGSHHTSAPSSSSVAPTTVSHSSTSVAPTTSAPMTTVPPPITPMSNHTTTPPKSSTPSTSTPTPQPGSGATGLTTANSMLWLGAAYLAALVFSGITLL